MEENIQDSYIEKTLIRTNHLYSKQIRSRVIYRSFFYFVREQNKSQIQYSADNIDNKYVGNVIDKSAIEIALIQMSFFLPRVFFFSYPLILSYIVAVVAYGQLMMMMMMLLAFPKMDLQQQIQRNHLSNNHLKLIQVIKFLKLNV